MHKLPLVQLAQLPVLFSELFRLQALLPHSCSCHTFAAAGLQFQLQYFKENNSFLVAEKKKNNNNVMA